jgi:hypothetical protein
VTRAESSHPEITLSKRYKGGGPETMRKDRRRYLWISWRFSKVRQHCPRCAAVSVGAICQSLAGRPADRAGSAVSASGQASPVFSWHSLLKTMSFGLAYLTQPCLRGLLLEREIRKLLKIWSGRPDSNRRRPAWESSIRLNIKDNGAHSDACRSKQISNFYPTCLLLEGFWRVRRPLHLFSQCAERSLCLRVQ